MPFEKTKIPGMAIEISENYRIGRIPCRGKFVIAPPTGGHDDGESAVS
jgi:hypothetical protein